MCATLITVGSGGCWWTPTQVGHHLVSWAAAAAAADLRHCYYSD